MFVFSRSHFINFTFCARIEAPMKNHIAQPFAQSIPFQPFLILGNVVAAFPYIYAAHFSVQYLQCCCYGVTLSPRRMVSI